MTFNIPTTGTDNRSPSKPAAPAAGWVLIMSPQRSAWHYFTAGAVHSLCGRAALPPDAVHLPGDDASEANCATCRARRHPATTAQKEMAL